MRTDDKTFEMTDEETIETIDEPQAKRLKLGTDNISVADDENVAHDQGRHPRKRKRRKRFFREIVNQMEFYFGDANLMKSKYLKEKMNEGPWIDLSLFLTFNKLAEMMRNFFGKLDVQDLWMSLKSIPSELLEVKEVDGKRMIKRSKPLNFKDQDTSDNCTIYLENIPPFASIDSLTKLFSRYGEVDYVSLPRYKHNMAIKGFAFIEFKEESGAKKAIANEKRMDPAKVNPAELQTVKSYKTEQAVEHGLSSSEGDGAGKERMEYKKDVEKGGTNEGNVEVDKTGKKGPSDDENGKEKTEETNKADVKKRKRNIKAKTHHNQQDHSDDQMLATFRIMTKSEWKRLRNKYLNLQKKNMSSAKGKLKQMNIMIDKRSGVNSAGQSAGSASQSPQGSHVTSNDRNTDKKQVPKKAEYLKGVIVRFDLPETVVDNGKQIKARIKASVMEPVGYVDAENGKLSVFVRCVDTQQAETVAGAKGIVGVTGTIIDGSEEEDYWKKIENDRHDKINKIKRPCQKRRGKERLVIKYEEAVQNTHKFFTDND